jgi:hypothetical protein
MYKPEKYREEENSSCVQDGNTRDEPENIVPDGKCRSAENRGGFYDF